MFINTVPQGKDSVNSVREATVPLCQSAEGYDTISTQFGIQWSTVRKISGKWKEFKTVTVPPRSGCPGKFTPRADSAMMRELQNMAASYQNLQASQGMLNVKVLENTIRRRLNRNRLFGSVARKKKRPKCLKRTWKGD